MISHTSRLHSTPLDTPADLAELENAVNDLPAEHRSHVHPVFDRVKQSTLRRRQILQLVQDALSQLRLDMKYLMFDLEATRRERDEFRRQLEETQG
ncbi:MAG: transcriptional regulator [Pirellulales bacterium]